jgi:hypothetical protein
VVQGADDFAAGRGLVAEDHVEQEARAGASAKHPVRDRAVAVEVLAPLCCQGRVQLPGAARDLPSDHGDH